jgi:hypothetical protein
VFQLERKNDRRNLDNNMAKSAWQKFIRKLWRMDRRELLDRGRQEVDKRADAVLATWGYDFARAASAGSTLSQTGRFFFRSEDLDSLLHLIRQRLPAEAGEIVARANRLCSHRFDLLGYEDLDYCNSINWHLDLVHGKTAPRKPFHRIQYLNFEEVGDSKVTWELNRHQHLVTLAKAYRLTGEQRFAEEIHAQWQSWHAQNPYPIGINWASSLEVGFRSLSWIWMHALLEGTKALAGEFRHEYLRAQAVNARHLERYLSTYFSPNTHLLGEGVALFFLGTMCSSLKGSERWKSLGWQIVLEESERQVNPDGFHFEQSTYYHVYALDLFLHAGFLASANGVNLPLKFEQTLERMMNALFVLGSAGPPPRFGDDDGGRLFDPARNRDEHLLDPLATGAILFGRGDFKALGRDLREETIWLVGEAGVAEWDRIEPKPVTAHSASLEDSGIYMLAVPTSPTQLIIRSGPSTPQSRGHSHADALSLCVQSSGRALLIDPGTYDYLAASPERNLYRGTSVHNTLTVDGLEQAEPDGPFSWRQEILARTEQWINGETFDLFAGSHDGYSRLVQPVQHCRWVVALKSGIFLVRDLVEGEGEHRLELSWRLAPELQLIQERLFRMKKSSQGLAVLPVQNHGWSEEVHKGPYSPVYGIQRTTTVLKFGTRSALPAEFVTLLEPLPEVAAIPGTFSRMSSEETSDMVRAYRYQTKETNHRFFFAGAGQHWKCGSVVSDGEFVCLLSKNLAETTDVILCNGSHVELEGRRVVAATRRIQRCELVNRDGPQLFSSDCEAMTTDFAAVRTNANSGTP